MAPDTVLPDHEEDVARFQGPHGVAAVRKPAASSKAPERIGDSHGTTFGFWRVAFVIQGLGTDVYQVTDEEEGREVARRLVDQGDLGGLEPNEGSYRVTAEPPYRRSDPDPGS